MWLHMGAFGPRRVSTVNGPFTPPAPYKLVDNTERLLDKTDLVFIDAMGTGYSHVVGKAAKRISTASTRTSKAFGAVHQHLRQPQRPLELAEVPDRRELRHVPLGRARQLPAAALHGAPERHRADFVGARSFVDHLRAPATTGLRVLPAELRGRRVVPQGAQEPAGDPRGVRRGRRASTRKGDYAAALFKGATLRAAEEAAVAKRLSYFTGLSEDYLLKANLRVTLGQFNAELHARPRPDGRTHRRAVHGLHVRPARPRTRRAIPKARPWRRVHGAHQPVQPRRAEVRKDPDYHNTSGGEGSWNWTRRARPRRLPPAPNVAGRPRAGHDHESRTAGRGRERLLRHGDAVLRDRVHDGRTSACRPISRRT